MIESRRYLPATTAPATASGDVGGADEGSRVIMGRARGDRATRGPPRRGGISPGFVGRPGAPRGHDDDDASSSCRAFVAGSPRAHRASVAAASLIERVRALLDARYARRSDARSTAARRRRRRVSVASAITRPAGAAPALAPRGAP